MKNLKVRKSLIALLLGARVITLSKEVKAEEVEFTDNTLVYEKEINENGRFKTTDTYYLSKYELSDSEDIRYVLLGSLDLDTYNNIVLSRISTNYIDAENRKFVPRERIIDSCFDDYHFEEYNDQVQKVVNSDGVVLGYTPEFKILIYE